MSRWVRIIPGRAVLRPAKNRVLGRSVGCGMDIYIWTPGTGCRPPGLSRRLCRRGPLLPLVSSVHLQFRSSSLCGSVSHGGAERRGGIGAAASAGVAGGHDGPHPTHRAVFRLLKASFSISFDGEEWKAVWAAATADGLPSVARGFARDFPRPCHSASW